MVKVLVYAYATGVFILRKIERRLHEGPALRMLAAGNFLRRCTICKFRAFHLQELFVRVVKLAREMGLAKLGTVGMGSTKVKADASRHRALGYERMMQTEVERQALIDALLARAKAADEAEANEPDLDLDLPAEMEQREARLAAIREHANAWRTRQRAVDLECGRSDDDNRRPRVPEMADPRAGATSVSSACPRTRRRRTSPGRTAAS